MIELVGPTGGIGSGKSTVARMLRERGIPVIDADAIARQVVEPGWPAHGEIAAAWPEVIAADGHIDRKKLVETGFYKQLDGLVVVSLGQDAQVDRVMARDACSGESALARIRAQRPVAEKIRVADHVLDNGGDIEPTRAQIALLRQAMANTSEAIDVAPGRPTRN